jgi:hypothetical protein
MRLAILAVLGLGAGACDGPTEPKRCIEIEYPNPLREAESSTIGLQDARLHEPVPAVGTRIGTAPAPVAAGNHVGSAVSACPAQ